MADTGILLLPCWMPCTTGGTTYYGRNHRGPAPPAGCSELLEVLVDQLGHLEHRYRALAAEHGLELVVGIDVATVLLVLQAVALDVGPDLLGDLGARHRART